MISSPTLVFCRHHQPYDTENLVIGVRQDIHLVKLIHRHGGAINAPRLPNSLPWGTFLTACERKF